MTKSEIIEAMVSVLVPPGATLVEHTDRATGWRVAEIDMNQAGPRKLLGARIMAEVLSSRTSDLSDAPSPEFFSRLYQICFELHLLGIMSGAFDDVAQELILDGYRKVIGRLDEISRRLDIAYEKPIDPLLDSE